MTAVMLFNNFISKSIIFFILTCVLPLCYTVEQHICFTYEEYQSMNANQNNDNIASGNFVNVNVNEWSPLQMTNGNGFSFGNFALVVLSTPIELNPDQMVTFWNKAAFRVTVDGGTDEWYSFRKNLTADTVLVREDPDFVTGDFDSIGQDLLEICYKNNNITVINTPDQNNTDFTKALEEISKHEKKSELDSVLVIVEHAGRLDEILSNVDSLYKAGSILGPRIVVFLLTKDSLTWLLKPGFHNIHIPMRLWQPNCWCGLLPLSGPTVVTTTGLKWDLKKQVLRFGELISTSNTYGDKSFQREGVTIKTDKEIIWIMGTCSENE